MLLSYYIIIISFCSSHINCTYNRGRQSEGSRGSQPPLNSEEGVEPSLIWRFFLIDHICYYVQVISVEGGGGLVPLKLIQLYSICIFIYIEILKCEHFIA